MSEFINNLTNFELSILDFISVNLTNPVLDFLMPIISAVCNHGEIWIVCSVILMCFSKTRKAGVSVAVALILGFLIGNMTIKPLVARIRPYELTQVSLLISQPKDYSFPSGHTLASFESAFAIFFNNRKLGIVALIVASVIAFSRLYLYVHFPTDIIAGVILGFVIAVVSKKLSDKIKIIK